MSYCQQLNTQQVRNVLELELDRMKRYPKNSPTWNSSNDLVNDAKQTLINRGE